MAHITVVGGGLGGLYASIACAEAGARVTLVEARHELGGRARSTDGDFVANYGPHVLYDDGPLWAWLHERGLAEPAAKASPTGIRFCYHGTVRRIPPLRVARVASLLRNGAAPVGVSAREWISAERDPRTAAVACRLCHVFTFHHDPGSLSAAFLAERARRAFALPPSARYIPGGWKNLVARLVRHARDVGVHIVLGRKVTELCAPPVIVALDLRAARSLLSDPTLVWKGARTVLLDVGLERHRGDPFLLFDLDKGVFFERYSKPDPSLAPTGTQLIQAQMGISAGVALEEGIASIEEVFDDALPRWRDRQVWRQSRLVENASGALDPPGTTWRDRPAVDRGGGVFLVGDMVGAPGLLSEVSWASALHAARLATRYEVATPAAASSP
jgi:NAD(P)-binding Rossmann-like domain